MRQVTCQQAVEWMKSFMTIRAFLNGMEVGEFTKSIQRGKELFVEKGSEDLWTEVEITRYFQAAMSDPDYTFKVEQKSGHQFDIEFRR